MSLERNCVQHTQTQIKHTSGKVRVLEGRIYGWNSVDKEGQGDRDRKEWKGMELRSPRKRNVGASGLTDLAVVPREKPHTGAAARESPRDSPVIAEMRAFVSCMA